MKILVIVDMQNDFINMALANKDAEAVVKPIVELTKNYNDIILTRDTHYSNYMETQEGRKLPIPHCIYGTEGWDINMEILNAVDKKNIAFLDKPNFGATEDAIRNAIYKDLLIAQNAKIDSIDIVGTCTDICVVSNALTIKHMFPETEVNIIANCCAGLTPEKHEHALDVMTSCQCNIIR